MTQRDWFKKQVKRRHKELKAAGEDIKLMELYNIMSREAGHKDWNTYSAHLWENENFNQEKYHDPQGL